MACAGLIFYDVLKVYRPALWISPAAYGFLYRLRDPVDGLLDFFHAVPLFYIMILPVGSVLGWSMCANSASHRFTSANSAAMMNSFMERSRSAAIVLARL